MHLQSKYILDINYDIFEIDISVVKLCFINIFKRIIIHIKCIKNILLKIKSCHIFMAIFSFI